jgi:hypothetical protein
VQVAMTKTDDVEQDFKRVVNMTPKQLEKWLDSDESKAVGQKKDGGESTGHESGRHILKILAKKKADLTEADHKHMSKVVGYVERHSAQRPSGDISETPWRYSLMNWGHDPLK